VREVIIINRAHTTKILTSNHSPTVTADAGANIASVAQQVALHGMSGLEWAAHIPGSVGGAIYGNAGTPDGDMQGSLIMADILHRDKGRVQWPCDRFAFSYRSSNLKNAQKNAIEDLVDGGRTGNSMRLGKKCPDGVVILGGMMSLSASSVENVMVRMTQLNEKRRRVQPTEPSMGSTFKNPPGDFAGRLLEKAGIKGTSIGGVQSSPIHANFFINIGNANAKDYWDLITLARKKVLDMFGVWLELEIELMGDWQA